MNSNSEPCVSAPSKSVSSVSRKVKVWVGPYVSTLIFMPVEERRRYLLSITYCLSIVYTVISPFYKSKMKPNLVAHVRLFTPFRSVKD